MSDISPNRQDPGASAPLPERVDKVGVKQDAGQVLDETLPGYPPASMGLLHE